MDLPGQLTAERAATLLTAEQETTQRMQHLRHQVTTCPSCNALWRMDQLRTRYEGYFPAQHERAPIDDIGGETLEQAQLNPAGARYARLCPFCQTDVTELVNLHADACRLTSL